MTTNTKDPEMTLKPFNKRSVYAVTAALEINASGHLVLNAAANAALDEPPYVAFWHDDNDVIALTATSDGDPNRFRLIWGSRASQSGAGAVIDGSRTFTDAIGLDTSLMRSWPVELRGDTLIVDLRADDTRTN